MSRQYYYAPFKLTDMNERKTWEKYFAKPNCVFVPATQAADAKELYPGALATQLLGEGLPDRKINIRLLICYGAGRSEYDPRYQKWLDDGHADNIFAKNLAMKLRTATPSVRVGGYQGPTQTSAMKHTVVSITGEALKGVDYGLPNVSQLNAVRVYNPSRTESASTAPAASVSAQALARAKPAAGVLPNDQVAPFTQQYGSVSPKAALAITRGAGVEKMFIVWYDTTGQTSVKHRPADAITASPTVIQPGTPKPLAVLADYDTLLIMAHGCADGKMVSSPGATMAALGGMNAVNAAERVRHG